MKTKAVRLYGKNDLRLEEFELPEITDNEILARVVSDSLCMSSYKAAIRGTDHKRVPEDIHENPIIIGHEFCGELIKVGKNWRHKFEEGIKFVIQPALNPIEAPGYSFRYIGGNATHIVIPSIVMEMDCLLPYNGEAFFYGSLAEPMCCIIGAYHASYHTKRGKYVHDMGIVKGGKMAILAGAGPMGLGAIDYAVHREHRPSFIAVTDIDNNRLKRAMEILPPEKAAKNGVKLVYVNTSEIENPVGYIKELAGGGLDDVFVYAPVKSVVEMGDALLGRDGCLNFFAGPADPAFTASFNFYNVHYESTHIVGTTGGNTDDMRESIAMMETGQINPASMITHVGGLDSVVDATLNLHKIPGGKKLTYSNISMPLTAINDFSEMECDLFAGLSDIVAESNGLWSAKAEKYLLENAETI